MKKIIFIISLLFISSIYANDTYIEGQVGLSNFGINKSSFPGLQITDNTFSGGLKVGTVYPTTSKIFSFGLEFGLDYAGEASIGPLNFYQVRGDLLGILYIKTTDTLDLMLKFGAVTVRESSLNSFFVYETEEINPKFAIGGVYTLNEDIAMTATLDYIPGSDSSTIMPTQTTNIMFGLRYFFS